MAKMNDTELLKTAVNHYRVAVRHQQKWKRDAKKAFRFYSGDQLNDDDKHKLEQEKRPIVTFNVVAPNVDAVVGMQRANRTEVRYSAHEGAAPEEQMFCDWSNTLLKKCDEDCDAEMETSEAFRDAVICGMGWTQRTIDYDSDPKGIVLKRTIDPLRKWWDPSAKRHNLIDRRFDFTEIFLDQWEFDSMFPEFKGKGAIVGGPAGVAPDAANDPFSVGGEEHEQFDTEVEHEEAQDPYRGEHSSPDGAERLRGKIRVVEYNYWRYCPTYLVFGQEDREIDEDQWDDFKKAAEIQGLRLMEVAAGTEPGQVTDPSVVFYQCINKRMHYKAQFSGPNILCHEINLDPCNFNEHCVTGSYDRAMSLWYGIVKAMIDPQLWSNKLFMQIMLVVMSNPKGGAYFKKGAFKNIEKAKEDYAQASTLIEVVTKEGEKIADVIQERQPSPYPQGLHEVMSYAANIIPRVTGLNMELLGMAQKDQPGILEHLRQQAGMTILASLFDSLRAYHKLDGRTALYFFRHEVSPSRQQEILGKTNAQLAQVIGQLPYDLDKFSIAVDEAPYSPNRKFLVFKMLTDLGTTNPELQSMVFPLLLDYMPLPQSAVETIKQNQAQQQQAQSQRQDAMDSGQAAALVAQIKEMIAHAELYTAQAAKAQAEIGQGDAEATAKVTAAVGDATMKMAAAHKSHTEAVAIKTEGLHPPPRPAAGDSKSGPAKPLSYSPTKKD